MRRFTFQLSLIAIIALSSCAKQTPDVTRGEKFNVEFGKTNVYELFTNDQVLYYIDKDSSIIYGAEKDYEAIRNRLKVTKYDGSSWQLDIGPFKGEYAVKPSNEVNRSLTVAENSAAGIKGYKCVSSPAGTCFVNTGTNTSSRLVNAETLCVGPSDEICDAVWRQIPVDRFPNKACTPPGQRIQENNALCFIP